MNDLKAQLQKLSSSPPHVDLFPSISSIESHNSDHSQLMRPLLVPGFSPVLTSFSSDLEDFDHGNQESSNIINEAEHNLSIFFSTVKQIQSNIQALRDILRSLRSKQEKLSRKYTKSLSNVMELDISDLVSQALCIKLSLDTLEQDNEDNRKLGGNIYQKGSSTDRMRQFITNKLKEDLRGFIADLSSLQEMMRDSEKSDLRRMLYIFKGEIAVSDEELENMIDSGEGHELIRKAIREQGLGNIEKEQRNQTDKHEEPEEHNQKTKVLNRHEYEGSEPQMRETIIQIKAHQQSTKYVKEEKNIQKRPSTNQSYNERLLLEQASELSYLQEVENAQLKSDFMEEIHQRYGSMKKLEENLMALKQTFLQMGGLVDLQGEELSDIEKNMVESLSFIKIAVGETAGAKEERKSAIATKVTAASVAITLVFLLLIVGLIILLLLLFIPGHYYLQRYNLLVFR